MPNIGAMLFGSGIIISMQCITMYIIDAYSTYAASAVAATTVLRAIAGFGMSAFFSLLWGKYNAKLHVHATAFPIFAPYMYVALGHGWADSILAFVAIAVGLPSPWLFWTFGMKLRAQSQYAMHVSD